MLFQVLANARESFWMPERASTFANEVDWLFYCILGVCVFLAALIFVPLVVFVIRYRHRGPNDEPMAKSPSNSTALQLIWTIVPTLIVLTIFYFGFIGYLDMSVVPPNAYEIQVSGKMSKWSFIYPNGYSDGELHVPKGIPVHLVLTSEDVIHDLYIPAFRIKKDAVPGRYNKLWFQASRTGSFDAYFAEYGGNNYPQMMTKVVVHEPEEFDAWLEKASNWENRMTPLEAGKMFFNNRGCNQCHTVDGTRMIGPSLKDLYGSMQPLTNGAKVLADEAYLRESILVPGAKIVEGYTDVMPSYQGTLKERDLRALILWMKSQSVHSTTAPTTKPAGAADAESPPRK